MSLKSLSAQIALRLGDPRGVLSGALGVGVITSVRIGATFVATTLLARLLGPDQFGLVALVVSSVLLISLPLHAGLPQLIVREVARNEVTGCWDLTAGLYRLTKLWLLAGTCLLLFPLAIYAFSRSGEEAGGYWTVMAIGMWIAPIYAFASINASILRGLRLATIGNVGDAVVRPLVLMCGAIVLASVGRATAIDAITLQLMSYIACAIAVSGLYRWHRPVEMRGAQVTYQWQSWLKAGLPFTLLALTLGANNQIQAVLIGIFSETEQNGFFATASSISYFVSIPLVVMNLVVAPHFAKLHSADAFTHLQRLATKTARASLAVTLPIAVILCIFGNDIIGLVFGNSYAGTYLPAVILIVGQLANVAAGPCGQILNMTGNERYTVWAVLAGLIVNLVGGIILVPEHGAIGAAIASGLGFLVWNGSMIAFARRVVGIDSSILGWKVRDRSADPVGEA